LSTHLGSGVLSGEERASSNFDDLLASPGKGGSLARVRIEGKEWSQVSAKILMRRSAGTKVYSRGGGVGGVGGGGWGGWGGGG